ncbi:unnamed protein product [Brugia timori]|uniref:G-protein coupled receptors family 1 profile domain-containing protein n=1 Tax=Brugia timori TaxID=42155 RepID=A0A3P7VVX7_9BILA|nr:unnamed protein product [Brugia timori]
MENSDISELNFFTQKLLSTDCVETTDNNIITYNITVLNCSHKECLSISTILFVCLFSINYLTHQNRLCLSTEKQAPIPSDNHIFLKNNRERLSTDNMIVRYYCIVALFLILPLNCHEGNATNVFDIRDEQHIIIKYTVVAVFSFLVLYGIISNFLMITVCYSRNNLYSRPFTLIVSQIIISVLVSFIPYVIILLPGILLSKKYAYKMSQMNNAFCNVRTYSIISMIYFSFLLTLNRFIVVILPRYNIFFQSPKLYFLLLFIWLIAFATSFGDFYFYTRHFQVSTLHCSKDYTKHSGGKLFNRLLVILLFSLSIAMVVMYTAIICNIRRRFVSVSNETQKTFVVKTGPKTYTLRTVKYERSMLIQIGLTSGGLIFGILIFSVLPVAKIFGQESLIAMNIFQCFYITLYRCALPTTFFLTSERARKFLNTNVVKPIQILTKQVTR